MSVRFRSPFLLGCSPSCSPSVRLCLSASLPLLYRLPLLRLLSLVSASVASMNREDDLYDLSSGHRTMLSGTFSEGLVWIYELYYLLALDPLSIPSMTSVSQLYVHQSLEHVFLWGLTPLPIPLGCRLGLQLELAQRLPSNK